MKPRRLLAFLAVFVVLAGAYFLLSWQESRKEAAEQAAKRLFRVKDAHISALTLKKGKEVIRLEKQEKVWQITRPVQAKADQDVVRSLVSSLAYLSRERTLGEEKDLKPFGLDQPTFILEFSAQGKAHRLVIGSATPGKHGYYAQRDQSPEVLVISAADKYTLDRPLTALRDKRLVEISVAKVKRLKIRLDSLQADLRQVSPAVWKWSGREKFKVRPDRVECLLRRLDMARIKEFVSEKPRARELAAFGLAPQPQGEVIITQGKEETATLFLGRSRKQDIYARKGRTGPVFLVDQRLLKDLQDGIARLEDRRLWTGQVAEVHQVVWGPPGQTWTAVKEAKSWKLTGPDRQSLSQSALRLEAGLVKFQDLEYTELLPAVATPQPGTYLLELKDSAGKPLLALAELAKPDKDKVEVSLKRGEKVERALVPLKPYQEWQEYMQKLTEKPGESG